MNACLAGMWKLNPSPPQMYGLRKTFLKSVVRTIGTLLKMAGLCWSAPGFLAFQDGQRPLHAASRAKPQTDIRCYFMNRLQSQFRRGGKRRLW